MINKKIILIIPLLILVFITGCSNSQEEKTNSKVIQETNSEVVEETKNMSVINCTREATASSGIDVSLSYKVYYEGDYIKILHSIEKITSSKSSDLDEYEKSYKSIFENYKGLKYYDNTITRDSNSIVSDTVINYGKIDTNKLLEIEGEEDNVIEDGKVKVKTWIDFAKKLGAKCDN